MSWKERLEEEKQRREARAYFRKNNSEFFSLQKWLKIIFLTILSGIIVGAMMGLFTFYIGIHFSALYLLGAYIISKICTCLAETTNLKLMVLCMLGYSLMIILAFVFNLYGLEYLSYFNLNDFIHYAISLFSGYKSSLLMLLFILMGYGYIYQNLK